MKLSQRVALLLILAVSPCLAAVPTPLTEKQSRELDTKALFIKKSAITSLGVALQSRKGSSIEPQLLLRQAELYQDAASISFRLAYGPNASPQTGKKTLGEFTTLITASLHPLTRLITTYPQFPGLPRAYRLRARVYEETGKPVPAVADLETLVKTWPKSSDAEAAHIELWTLLIAQKEYQKAIHYINLYGLNPKDKNYHAALEKLAWCSFYLNSEKDALSYTETELKTAKGLDLSKAMANLGLFYATGMEKKIPGFESSTAIAKFNTILAPENVQKVLIQFVYLLRSKGMSSDLQVIKEQASRLPMTDTNRADFLLAVSEDELNHQMWVPFKYSLDQVNLIYFKDSSLQKDKKFYEKVKTRYIAAANTLQKIIADSRQIVVPAPGPGSSPKPGASPQPSSTPSQLPPGVSNLPPVVYKALGSVYDFLLKTSSSSVLEQAKIHYDLGEAMKTSGDLEAATGHYRWIVDHLSVSKEDQKALYLSAVQNALETRYLAMKNNHLLGNELTARSLNSIPKQLPAPVIEWIDWVDHFPKAYYVEKKIDGSTFEACKILYFYDHVQEAIDRLNNFIKLYPGSPHATAAGSLIIDTYIESKEWLKTYQASLQFLEIKEWQKSDFHKKLVEVAADSYCKVLDDFYKRKDYANTLKGVDDFLSKNPTSNRKVDLLELAANASLGTGDKHRASGYFKQLELAGDQKTEIVNLSLMTNGSLAEETFAFEDAARSYLRSLTANKNTGGKTSLELKQKILLYAWFSGNARFQKEIESNKVLCPSINETECANYRTRIAMKFQLLDQIDRSIGETPKYALWKKIQLLTSLPEAWDKIDPLMRYSFVQKMFDTAQASMHNIRLEIRNDNPIRLDAKYIKERVNWIEKGQNAAEKLAKLPWTHVKLRALLEASGLYEDVILDFEKVKPPRGLRGKDKEEYQQTINDATSPFRQKRDDLLKEALALATQSNLNDSDMAELVAAAHRPDLSRAKSEDLFNKDLIDMIRPGSPEKPQARALVDRFKQAIEKANWVQAGFLIQWIGSNKTLVEIPPASVALMKALLLKRVGATSEAIGELKSALADFNGSDKAFVNKIIQQTTLTPEAAKPVPSPSPSAFSNPSPSQKPVATPNPSQKPVTAPSPAPSPSESNSGDSV